MIRNFTAEEFYNIYEQPDFDIFKAWCNERDITNYDLIELLYEFYDESAVDEVLNNVNN